MKHRPETSRSEHISSKDSKEMTEEWSTRQRVRVELHEKYTSHALLVLEENALGSNDFLGLFLAGTCFMTRCYKEQWESRRKNPLRPWYFFHGFIDLCMWSKMMAVRFFLPFFLNFSLQRARLNILLCGADHALQSGICLHFEKQNIYQTMKWKYRRSLSTSAKKWRKTTPRARISTRCSILRIGRGKSAYIRFDAELNGLQNERKKFLADQVWTSQKVKILVFAHGEKHESPTVFRVFCIHIDYESKCRICRFVAPVTSFRILLKSNGKSPRKVEKKVKNTFPSILTIFSAFLRCVFVVYSLFQELLGLKPWYFGISYRQLCLTFLRCQNPKTRTLMFWLYGQILDFFMDRLWSARQPDSLYCCHWVLITCG